MLGSNDVITHVIALLQEINGNVEGIEKAPVVAPQKMTGSKLPVSIVWEGQGEASGQIGLATMENPFIIEVLMFPATVGYRETNFEKTREMHGRFLDTYFALQNDAQDYVLDYGLESGVRVMIDKKKTITYSGAQSAMEYMPQVAYYGFRLSVPIIARWGENLL